MQNPPKPAYFDGHRFHNQQRSARSLRQLLRWLWQRKPGPWQRNMKLPPGPPPPARVAGKALRVTFVNHATVLIQTGGLNILTDPIWSQRASPLPFFGPRRYRPPGIRFEDLPGIDAVLLSHDHYDHMDIPTLRRLHQRDAPLIVAGLRQSEVLGRHGLTRVVELDWWQQHALAEDFRLYGVPARHWTGRGLRDQGRRLWLGFVIETPGGMIYFAGDTGMGPHFEQIHARFGPPRLALLPIGAWLPEWFMAPVHISPAQAVAVHQLMAAETSVGIHYGTFRLADDGQHDAPRELRRARKQAGLRPEAFRVLEFGEGRNL